MLGDIKGYKFFLQTLEIITFNISLRIKSEPKMIPKYFFFYEYIFVVVDWSPNAGRGGGPQGLTW